jgi:drug/metabolite transporter (DMT)-like permease
VSALASAVGYGASDFAAGLASRKVDVLAVTFLATLCSLAVSALALPWMAGHGPSAAALAWRAGSGLGGLGGALCLYAGFRQAAFSVAGPLSAVSSAGLSVIAGVALGERPSALSLAGIVAALPAIVLVSLAAGPASQDKVPGAKPAGTGFAGATPAEAGSADPAPGQAGRPACRGALAGVGFGLAAGVGFALLFVGLNRAGSAAGVWPVIAGQVAEVIVMAGIVMGTRRALPRGAVTLSVLTGVAGGGATILYFVATHKGFLAIAAVLTSLYPAVTIGLARVFASERLSAARLAGRVLAGLSVALIALGGTGRPAGLDARGRGDHADHDQAEPPFGHRAHRPVRDDVHQLVGLVLGGARIPALLGQAGADRLDVVVPGETRDVADHGRRRRLV